MPNLLANRHPVIAKRLQPSTQKPRTDEVWIAGTGDPDQVQVSGGCWYARGYHGFVILSDHNPLVYR